MAEDNTPDEKTAQNTKGQPQESLEPAKIPDNMLYAKVYAPYHVYFDGAAKSISAENDTGPFDVLPKHHNFITLVNTGEITIRPEAGEDIRLRITRGLMHVRHNKVTVFLDV